MYTVPVKANPNRYKNGSDNLDKSLIRCFETTLKPPPVLTLSEWADKYAYLSPESASEPGKFKAYGFQRGMLDAVTDPANKKITYMKSARVGYPG
jgi:phage terminase large subunit GpA-like protein